MTPVNLKSNRVTRAAKAATALAVAALSLGTVNAEPVSANPFVAKAESLNPGPHQAGPPSFVVQLETAETPQAAPARAVRRGGGGGGGCGLGRIKQKESGGNYGAVSRSGKYRGAYQFDQRTWESTGGSGDPAQASPAEQDARAGALYARRGSRPWNC